MGRHASGPPLHRGTHAYVAVWAQLANRVRVIGWMDRGRDRLLWFDTEADAQATVERMEERLVAAGSAT